MHIMQAANLQKTSVQLHSELFSFRQREKAKKTSKRESTITQEMYVSDAVHFMYAIAFILASM